MVKQLTSLDAATSGSVVNQVELAYDDFGSVETEYQEHDGEKDGNTPSVGYTYTDGTNNHHRLTKITYPNGRLLHFGYYTTDGNVGRLSYQADDNGSGSPGTHLTHPYYLGVGHVVKSTRPEAPLAHYVVHSGYSGLDRFNRVVDLVWQDYGATPCTAARIKHGYDRAGNRLWREDVIAAGQSVHQDEPERVNGFETTAGRN